MLLSFLAALAIAGKADTAIGSRSSIEAMQGLHAYGQCVAIQRPVEVRALLAMDFGDPAYGRKMIKLVNKPAPCTGVEVPRGDYSSGTLLWGGALAEGMLRRDRTLERLGVATAHNSASPAVRARGEGEMMAFCVVRTGPDATAALLRTDPGTDEELTALKAMSPTLSGCLAANSKVAFTRDSLRAMIALGAYRLATHNNQANASGAAN